MFIHKVFQIIIGFFLASMISWLAEKLHYLTKKGMVAAIVVGGIIFSSGRTAWSALILIFFFSSSLLSRISQKDSAGQPRPGTRDWGQVLANGSTGAIFALLFFVQPEWQWPAVGYAGALAAVTADTWATEIGTLSRRKPRLITTWKPVPPGTSGGITPLGTVSAVAGSACISLSAALLFQELSNLWILAGLLTAGLLGSFLDSFLGATIQAMYRCPSCEKMSEQHPFHHCQTRTEQIRGWSWLTNDGVNFLSSLGGALLAILVWYAI